MLASLISIPSNIGYPLLVVLVMAESAGVPVPGETALILGGALASRGKLQIEWVIALAATAAIVGDNFGYLIGRKGGRWLLERPGWFERQRHEVLRVGEPFFDRHGPKAVFFGRWILGLRTWASWLAGATAMPWKSFVAWNALGGISWAITIGLLAYFLGHSVSNVITSFGIYGLIGVLLAGAGALGLRQLHRRYSQRGASAGEGGRTQRAGSRGSPPPAAGDEDVADTGGVAVGGAAPPSAPGREADDVAQGPAGSEGAARPPGAGAPGPGGRN